MSPPSPQEHLGKTGSPALLADHHIPDSRSDEPVGQEPARHGIKRSTMSDARLTKKQRKAVAFRHGRRGADTTQEVQAGRGGEEARETRDKKKAVPTGQAVQEPVVGNHPGATEQPRKGKGKAKAASRYSLDPDAGADASSVANLGVKKSKKIKTNKNKLPSNGDGQSAPSDLVASSSSSPANDAGAGAGKKRKRNEVADAAAAPAATGGRAASTRKRFDADGNAEALEETKDAKQTDEKGEAAANDQRRFIVFVGNMSFKSTADDLGKHFASHCGETPTVRLLTKRADTSKRSALSKSKQKSIAKGKAADPGAATSKGCAFVEFASHRAIQKALQYHHTQFQGRSINVELTAGGGGKGQDRKARIDKKNKELEEERRKLHDKYVKGKKGEKQGPTAGAAALAPAGPDQPQWGPNATSKTKAPSAGKTKIPRWAASGANAIQLSS